MIKVKREAAGVRARAVGTSGEKETGRDTLLTVAEALKLDKQVSGGKAPRLFFDNLPVWQAIQRGFQMTLKNYFEGSEFPAAAHTVTMISKLRRDLPPASPLPIVLEPFGGTGLATQVFTRGGYYVLATELNETTHHVAVHNLTLARANNYERILGDGVALLKKRAANQEQVDVVFLDPPWNGKYKYDLAGDFELSNMEPDGRFLVETALKVAPIVAIKTPQNISVSHMFQLAKELGVGVRVERQNIKNYPPEFCPATVYFIRGSTLQEAEKVTVW